MSRYIHGTSPPEQDRLSRLNDFFNAACLERMRLRPGERVIDFGSGLGQLTRAMARASGAPVVGIERDPEQLETARRLADAAGESDLVEFRAGDATSPPLGDHEWGTFDVAHARFVLEHVRDPRIVVGAMMRAVRPGGRVVVLDDHHPLMTPHPECPGFGAIWGAYMRSYDRIGVDPHVGARLVALLHGAGATGIRNSMVFFGGCAGGEHWDLIVENLRGVIAGARETMLEHQLIDAPTLDAGLEAIGEWGRRPDGALWYAIPWAEGVRGA
ncbi:MAG: methyltransferase domain-containing protein [Phycisphaeraceae bacterium]|nr:methyltransferase domain-containing protein [Phycisphaeraceae bacterium]